MHSLSLAFFGLPLAYDCTLIRVDFRVGGCLSLWRVAACATRAGEFRTSGSLVGCERGFEWWRLSFVVEAGVGGRCVCEWCVFDVVVA